MKIWLLCKTDPIKPIGVFLNQDSAKGAAVDGRYLVLPIEAGETYNDLLDENLPGALYFDREGYEQAVQAVKNALADIRSDISDTNTRIDNLQATVTTKLQNINNQLTDLDARVTALEGGG